MEVEVEKLMQDCDTCFAGWQPEAASAVAPAAAAEAGDACLALYAKDDEEERLLLQTGCVSPDALFQWECASPAAAAAAADDDDDDEEAMEAEEGYANSDVTQGSIEDCKSSGNSSNEGRTEAGEEAREKKKKRREKQREAVRESRCRSRAREAEEELRLKHLRKEAASLTRHLQHLDPVTQLPASFVARQVPPEIASRVHAPRVDKRSPARDEAVRVMRGLQINRESGKRYTRRMNFMKEERRREIEWLEQTTKQLKAMIQRLKEENRDLETRADAFLGTASLVSQGVSSSVSE